MMEKQVCSMVHEAYAGQKGEFFVEKARTFFHPVTDSFQKDLTEGHSQKRCKRVSALSLQKLH